MHHNYTIINIGHHACLRENGDLSPSQAKPYRQKPSLCLCAPGIGGQLNGFLCVAFVIGARLIMKTIRFSGDAGGCISKTRSQNRHKIVENGAIAIAE